MALLMNLGETIDLNYFLPTPTPLPFFLKRHESVYLFQFPPLYVVIVALLIFCFPLSCQFL